jgi:histidinol-phosphate aminotransferase
MAALRDALSESHRYPDDSRREFKERVAQLHRVTPEQVLIGCGSVEILKIAGNAFTGPGRKLVMASPTFEVIASFAQAGGAEVVQVRLAKNFAHDLTAMAAQLGQDTGLVYVCNPNNPTASLTPRRDLDELIAKLPERTYLLMDEAYHHFATDAQDYTSFLDRPTQNDRVIVARTFSKVYGLAGMRLGYGIGARATIDRMHKAVSIDLKGTDNANVAGLQGALAALKDEEGMRTSVRRNATDREEFVRQAQRRKLSPIPPHANFAMMDVGRPVVAVIEHFKERGILVGRPFPPLDTYLRVSFGQPEEMKKFWRAWDQLPKAAG